MTLVLIDAVNSTQILRDFLRGTVRASGYAYRVEAADELRRQIVVDVRCAPRTRKQDYSWTRPTPVQHLEPHRLGSIPERASEME
jgi:hypothetical protein